MTLDAAGPFAAPSQLPFELPDYAAFDDEQYRPAIEAGMAEQLVELEIIAANPGPATVENVIEAWESSGRVLHRAYRAFSTKQVADTNPVLDVADAAIAPQLAAHLDKIYLNRALYDRVAELARRAAGGELSLEQASAYWLERNLLAFERAGVNLPETDQARLRELNQRIAELQSLFAREALAGLNAAAVLVTQAAELEGLSDAQILAARERAAERGYPHGWLIELEHTTGQSVLDTLANRDLRRQVHHGSISRGLGGEHDTRALVVELARCRAERAALLGFGNHAAYVAAYACARTGEAVWDLLSALAAPAVANARAEAAEMAEVWEQVQPGEELQAWDWQYVAELVRTKRYGLDVALLRPYLDLERVLGDGVFAAAHGLYGITFTERPGLKGYHDEVRVFEVDEADGTPIGLLVADFYTRPGKQGGAWMNNLVDQNHLLGQRPVVMTNFNLIKPPAGGPTLISWDDVITLFHELGHALHGLLSDTLYPSQTGTETPPDFVEYPSQLNEEWALDPDLLSRFTVHHATGEPMPAEWKETLRSSTLFQAGYRTTEYLGAALLDQVWHRTPLEDLPSDPAEVEEFEQAALASVGLDFDLVPPRYRSTYFRHAFEGGYDAGYYSYLWSEVLCADTAAFIKANGGPTRENGERFRRLLAKGGSMDAMDNYRDYRGQDPEWTHLLVRRGLSPR